MKKRTFTAFAAVTALLLLSISCQKNESLSAKEKSISLVAPSGKHIAKSIQELRSDALSTLSSESGSGPGSDTTEQVEITAIEYLPVTTGYAAIVSYSLQNGASGRYGIFSGVKISLPDADRLTINSAPSAEQMREADGKVTISCKGTCTCRLSATINADTGVITVDCGCNGCSSSITQSE